MAIVTSDRPNGKAEYDESGAEKSRLPDRAPPVYTNVLTSNTEAEMPKPKPKATDPRNQHRGTKLTQLRLREDTLAQLARIRDRLSGPDGGAKCTVADAVRYAISRTDANISTAEPLENKAI